MTTHKITMLSSVLAILALALTGCEPSKNPVQGNEMPTQQGGHQAMPLPVVDVIVSQPQTVNSTTNLPGRIEASRKAVIIPRVSGIVEKRLFEEGKPVKAGQVLYQLDKGTFLAALKNAQGNLAIANSQVATSKAALKSARASAKQSTAQRDLAQKTLDRYNQLARSKSVSQQQIDSANANLKVQQSNINAASASVSSANAGIGSANAGVASAKAGVETAQINLNYTDITTPIDGVIGVSHVTEGAYVLASQTPMAEVQQLDPLYINITQPASAIIKLRQSRDASSENQIQVLLEDGTIYPHKAKLLFVNPTVNENTGEMSIRAEVPNPDGLLVPGLYVRVNVPQQRLDNAYLIPQQAVTRGQTDVVMIAEEDGSYHPQPVYISGHQNQNWIITQGLKPNQKVIIDGMGQMAIMMGAPKVQTRLWSANNTQANQSAELAKRSNKLEKTTENNTQKAN